MAQQEGEAGEAPSEPNTFANNDQRTAQQELRTPHDGIPVSST